MSRYQDHFETPDGLVLRPGDEFRIKGRRGVYTFDALVLEPRGKTYVMAYGPLLNGSGAEGGGQCFYVGKPTTRMSPITGKRKRLRPVTILPTKRNRPRSKRPKRRANACPNRKDARSSI